MPLPQGAWIPFAGHFTGIVQLHGGSADVAPPSIHNQAATHKIAYRFILPQAVTLTGFDVMLTGTGTTTGITIKGHIETETGSDQPSGTLVGTDSATFSPPAGGSAAWVGAQTFGSTAALSANTHYWLVLIDGGGTAPTTSNYYSPVSEATTGGGGMVSRVRNFNGTNWTTISARQTDHNVVFITNDTPARHIGYASAGLTSVGAGAIKIQSTTREGLKFRIGGRARLGGATVKYGYTGTPPNDIEILLFHGATQLENVRFTKTLSVLQGIIVNIGWPSGPYTMIPGDDYYIMLHQNADGGSTANYYTCWHYPIQYADVMFPPNWHSVNGTATDPTTLTNDDTYIPVILPIVYAIDTDYQLGWKIPNVSSPVG
jgi:hypothetical protein